MDLISRDPRQASAFIIPYDAGVHSYIDHKDGFPRLASPHGWAAGDFLRTASRDKVSIPYFATDCRVRTKRMNSTDL
jgi:hypothetical protein